ncbi:MAG TPA: class I SAM-dependent methyltransferase [Kofleriaceae bacterium]|nr:class I SAM-dependent methyltransferase [Kofleriaceae bacterium]
MLTRHERWIDRMYGHGDGSITDSHRGYLNFGLWDDGIADYAAAAENLVAALGARLRLGPGARLLDVACGRGVQDLFLLRRFGALTIDAVDVTARNVLLARRQAAAHDGPGEVHVHRGSATRLPFDDASFTHAICVEAAFHFDTREAFLAEAHRTLAGGGRLALADIVLARRPASRRERALVDAACRLWRIPPANMVDEPAYRAMLERRGFAIESIEHVAARTFPGYYRSQRRPARRRELVAARGRVGATVGALLNYAAHRVFESGLIDYLLVTAVRGAR